jgi:hypothetical protein
MYCADVGALTASKLTGLNKNTTHRLYGLLQARVVATAKAKPLLLREASRWMRATSDRAECVGDAAEDRGRKVAVIGLLKRRGKSLLLFDHELLEG